MHKEIFTELNKAIQDAETERALEQVQLGLSNSISASDLVNKACIPAMQELGDLWEKGEIFLPELMLSAETMKTVMAVLTPKMASGQSGSSSFGCVVIGTIQGDIHDIGKSLVAAMLEASGFEVRDLGADVPLEKFCDEAESFNAQLICLSALLTTTMIGLKTLIEMLSKKGMRNNVKVMIGGAPVSRKWAEEIGPDGYGENAIEAVREARKLVASA